MSAWVIWNMNFESAGGARASGLAVTGITALILVPVFGCMYRVAIRGAGRENRKEHPAGEWLLLVPFGVCAALGLNQLMNLLHLTQLPGSYESTRRILFSGERMASVLILGLVVPMAEELMFRGLIFSHLKQMTGQKGAFIFSALLFGVYHGNLVQGIYAFLTGLILAYVYERFGSLFAPFLFHCTANIFVYLAADMKILGRMHGMIVSCAAGLAGMGLIFMHYRSKK